MKDLLTLAKELADAENRIIVFEHMNVPPDAPGRIRADAQYKLAKAVRDRALHAYNDALASTSDADLMAIAKGSFDKE